MSLLAPLFLLGGLAIGLPLWLHLLERQNPVRIPFSSLMFFERRRQSSLRERRIRYPWLLALRIALYGLLALAFAKPVWERAAAVALTGLPKLHLVILDTSLSMRYGDRWERALAAAEQALDAMESGDRAQVVANGPGIRLITEDPTANRGDLLAAIRSLDPTFSRNSYGEVAEAIRSLAPEGNLPLEAHVISDFQQTAMPPRFSDLTLPAAASLSAYNVAEEDQAANWTVESVRGTTRIYGERRSRLEATVAGFGAEEAGKTVELVIEGKRIGLSELTVPANGRATAVFEGFEFPAGASRAELRLSPGDELPEDDLRRVALNQSEPLPILFVYGHERRRDVLYYRAALDAEANSIFELQAVSPGQARGLTPSQFAFVVLSDVPSLPDEFAARLERYVEEGGSVLMALGPKTTMAESAPFYSAGVQGAGYAAREEERFLAVGDVQETHPALQRVERFAGVKFFRWARLSVLEDSEVLASLSDGSPLLIERRRGRGRVLVLASTFDNVWNDLPLHPVFVAFVHESARRLAGLEDRDDQFAVDSVLELRKRRGTNEAIQVFDPSGDRALSLSETVTEQGFLLEQAGFYEIRRPGGAELVAVNPDPRESDLQPMDQDTLAIWRSTGREAETASGAGAAGDEVKPPPLALWPFVLALLALIALIESVVGNRHLRVRREVQVS